MINALTCEKLTIPESKGSKVCASVQSAKYKWQVNSHLNSQDPELLQIVRLTGPNLAPGSMHAACVSCYTKRERAV
jgi:hypothetical protein